MEINIEIKKLLKFVHFQKCVRENKGFLIILTLHFFWGQN